MAIPSATLVPSPIPAATASAPVLADALRAYEHELRPHTGAASADGRVCADQSYFHRPQHPSLRSRLVAAVNRSAAAITNFVRVSGCSRLRDQSLHHPRSLKSFADGHSLSRLSSFSVFVGIDPNEIGLTHAQGSFAPGAKTYD